MYIYYFTTALNFFIMTNTCDVQHLNIKQMVPLVTVNMYYYITVGIIYVFLEHFAVLCIIHSTMYIYIDDDECTLNTDDCHTGASCTNTPGSFLCTCNAGYTGDGVTCIGKQYMVSPHYPHYEFSFKCVLVFCKLCL